MKLLILSQILVVCIALSSAAVFQGTYKDPKHPGKCVFKELNLVLSPGDAVEHPSYCGRLFCYEDNMYEGHTCLVVIPPLGCKLGKEVDAAAPYPDCCEREDIC